MNEAAIRHLPLTVQPAMVGLSGGVVTTAQDQELTEEVRTA
jgi:hypothetical protein